MSISRRSLFRGFAAIMAAPAIARVTQLIPPLERARLNYLGPAQITRESIRMFVDTNMFLRNIDDQYSDLFCENAKVGTQLRIRLLTDYRVISDIV